MRLISEIFRHPGHIYVYCPSKPLKAKFARDLEEQGFGFADGARVSERAHDFGDIMAVNRDFTIHFCGFNSHLACGSLRNPVYVREDRSDGIVRVDYARFISGAENYIIRSPRYRDASGSASAETGKKQYL